MFCLVFVFVFRLCLVFRLVYPTLMMSRNVNPNLQTFQHLSPSLGFDRWKKSIPSLSLSVSIVLYIVQHLYVT